MTNKYNIQIAYTIIAYLWIIYFIYIISPIELIEIIPINRLNLIVFLLLVSISFYLGCRSIPITRNKIQIIKTNRYYTGLKYLIIISLCSNIMVLLDNFIKGSAEFSFNIGEKYFESIRAVYDINSPKSLVMQIYTLLSPIHVFVLGYGAYCFLNLKLRWKVGFILMLLTSISYNLFCVGSQKGIGDLLIVGGSGFLIYSIQKNKIILFLKKIAILFSLFLAFFVFSQLSRKNYVSADISADTEFIHVTTDNLFYKIAGEKIGNGLITFGFYVSHGYQGLSYCLEIPFVWTHGYGSSMGISSYLTQYLNVDNVIDDTYPLRMERQIGWPGLMFWPTAFAWWASDLSFPGVIILMFFIGKLVCISFKEAYLYSNPISIALFANLSVLLIYLTANNQLFQTRSSCIASIVLFMIWCIKHKSLNKKYQKESH